MQVIEILVIAVIAGVVLARLYSVLGRRTGAERPNNPAPQTALGELGGDRFAPTRLAPAAGAALPGGLAVITRADPSFDATQFLAGARSAYELIVTAFAKGDKAALQPLLTARVFDAYGKAIEERESRGEKGADLIRLKSAELVDGAVEGTLVRASVKYEAELAEGAHGMRDTKEKWTFERDARSADPNWRLARVVAA